MNPSFITFPIILTVFSAVLVFSLGLMAFLRDKKSKLNIVFFLYSIFTTIWLIGNYKLLNSCSNPASALFWDRFIYGGVVFIPSAVYHFVNIFTRSKSKIIVYWLYLLSGVFFATIFTNFFVSGLFVYKWGCHGYAGIFHNLFLLMFALSLFSIFFQIISYLKKTSDRIERIQAMYIFFSFLVLATLGSLGFLPAYGISIFPISYLAGTVAVVILSYAIFKHHLFNIRIIAAELFTYTISLTLFVRAFFAETTQNKVVGFIIFLFVSFFGVLLMRSVSKEVEARKEIEKLAFDLEKANERLKELDQLKSEFLSLASHQIRAPLTSIKGYASMIIEGDYGYMSEPVRQAVDVIYKSCQNLVLIVSEFLDISRIEQGRMKYDVSDFDLRKMTAEVLTELSPIIEKAGLSTELKADEKADYSVYGDQGKMKQILTNIVDNAVKYSKSGNITVTLSSNPSSIKVSVRDNGIGIAPEDIPKLFGKFIRAHDAFKTNVIGTGLGLYVARQMITAQGGKIWVESDGLGKGSTFYVEIPKSQNKASQN